MLSLSAIAMDNPRDEKNQEIGPILKQIQKALQAETKDRNCMRIHRDGNSPLSLRRLALKSCEPLLRKALETDNLNLLHQFFKINIDPDYRLPYYATGPMPLVVLAIKWKSLKCLKFLITKGADLEDDYFFDPPLIIAAQEGNLECLKALVHAGVNVNTQNTHCIGGETALHEAVNKGHYECTQILLEAGAEINSKSYCGKTPLMRCIPQWDNYETGKKKLECMRLLIKHRVALDQIDDFGNTAVMLAAEHAKVEHLELLLKAGARWDLKNNKGYTALELIPDWNLSCTDDCKKMLQNARERHPAINFLWKLF